MGKGVEANAEKTSITAVSDYLGTSYSNTTISSWTDGYIYKWSLRIDRKSDSGDIMIGIATNHNEFHRSFTSNTGDPHFAYLASSGKTSRIGGNMKRDVFEQYGPPYGTGASLTVILDMGKRLLLFEWNGIDLGVAFDNLPKRRDLKYKLAIAMNSRYSQITLMNFQMMYSR